MRLATISIDAGPEVALDRGDAFVRLSVAAPDLPRTAQGVLALGEGVRPRLHALLEGSVGVVPASEARRLQPILRPGKILGIGLNYRDHAEETGRTPPTVQTWFVKQATAAHPPFDPVLKPAVSDALDYEAELVLVIGKTARFVPEERAHEVIGGYCVGCDYSVRDWQRATPTMIMGKGFDTHAPFGPSITLTGPDLNPLDLAICCDVNGEARQRGWTGDMLFTPAEQIAHLTQAFTLEPGDLIFTGTPAGECAATDPPRFLKPGDRVRCTIDGLGSIEQQIVAEKAEMRLE